LSAHQNARVREAAIVPSRVIVVFTSNTLPTDAAARVQKAGGRLIRTLGPVGIAIVVPVSVDGSTLIRKLRRDPAIFNAEYDRVVNLIAPAQVAADHQTDPTPTTHLAHPLPTFSPSLPADFFYTSSPQQWAVKRVGAAGGGVPTLLGDPTSGAWDVTFGAGSKIAILDTGVNPVHPDVKDNLSFNQAVTFYIPDVFGTPNCEVPDASNLP